MANNPDTPAMWSAIASIAGVIGTLCTQAVIRAFQNRGMVQSKDLAETARIDLFNRQELKRYMDDQRAQMTQLTMKVDSLQKQADELRNQNAQLAVDKAVLIAANEQLAARVRSLEAQVAQLTAITKPPANGGK